MTDAYSEIIDVIKEHRRDGFEVEGVRVPSDLFKEILQNQSFIPAIDANEYDFVFEESEGLVVGHEIIVDKEISEPVANDVKLR